MATRTLTRAPSAADAPDPIGVGPPDLRWAREHLDTWGFVHLRGVFADLAPTIVRDFDTHVREGSEVSLACPQFMAASDVGVRAGVRTAVADPLGPGSALGWLATSPSFGDLVRTLVGDEAHLFGSLANLYSCDVHWHHDGLFRLGTGRHVAVMMYLDVLDEATGALRVIPGSHHPGPLRDEIVAEVMRPTETPLERVFGLAARNLPSTVLETVPGDVIVLDFTTVHASFGGGIGRRLLTASYAEGAGSQPTSAPEAPRGAVCRRRADR